MPQDWLDTVRQATEDTVPDIASHLPDEAQEALLAAAVGEAPTVRIAAEVEGSGYAHPDAQRRFRVIGDQAELAAALDAPWDAWAVFLHPAQREFVDRDFNGPARVIGSAGTGKTVVALHRAVRLAAEAPENRVLLTTFSAELARGLADKIGRPTRGHPELASRITVSTLSDIARLLGGEGAGHVVSPAKAKSSGCWRRLRQPRQAPSFPAFSTRNGGSLSMPGMCGTPRRTSNCRASAARRGWLPPATTNSGASSHASAKGWRAPAMKSKRA